MARFVTTKTRSAKIVAGLDTANTIVPNSETSLLISFAAFVAAQGIWPVIVRSGAIPMLFSMTPLPHRMGRQECLVQKVSTLNMPVSWRNLAKGPQVVEVMMLPRRPGVPMALVFHRSLVRTFRLGVVLKCGSLLVSAQARVVKTKAIVLLKQGMGELMAVLADITVHPKGMDKDLIQAIKLRTDSSRRITQAHMHNTTNSSMRSSNPRSELSVTTSILTLTTHANSMHAL